MKDELLQVCTASRAKERAQVRVAQEQAERTQVDLEAVATQWEHTVGVV